MTAADWAESSTRQLRLLLLQLKNVLSHRRYEEDLKAACHTFANHITLPSCCV